MIRIATLLSGHGFSALATLARNLVLARILGPEHYAIAACVIVIIAAAELGTTLGLPQLAISHKQGASRHFQATLHAVQLTRGILGACLIFVSASPLAHMLDASEFTPILQSAALVPLILGFTHLDPYRSQRHHNHLPHLLVLCIPAGISLIALWPVSLMQLGPTAMLYLLLLQACVTVGTSHLVARRQYALRFQPQLVAIILRYGLPLATNGLLIFAALHAEKLIAGAQLGLADMGVLAMGFTLTLTPALVCARSFQAYHLPKLRSSGGSILGVSLLFGASLATTLAALVPLGLPILSESFSGLGALVPILSCIAAMRLPKSALATEALAKGRTHLPAFANIPRLLAAPIIWIALSKGGTIETLLAIAALAEVVGLGVGIRMGQSAPLPVKDLAIAAVVLVLILSGQITAAAAACIFGWSMYAFRQATIPAPVAT